MRLTHSVCSYTCVYMSVRIECKKSSSILTYIMCHLPSLLSPLSSHLFQNNLLSYFDIVYPSDGDREDLTTRELLSLIPAVQSGTREKLERMIEAGVGEASSST